MGKRSRSVCVGEKFNQWEVVEAGDVKSRCRCSCGRSERTIRNERLRNGYARKCKLCANDEVSQRQTTLPWAHQYPKKIASSVYESIRRCTNESYHHYQNWGGRGIHVCQQWLDDPAKFCEYLMGLPGWDNPDLCLDCVNNDGHYEPGNLRWATYVESLKNRRPCRHGVIRHTEEAKAKTSASVRAYWAKKKAAMQKQEETTP